jgi:hypothetical protein
LNAIEKRDEERERKVNQNVFIGKHENTRKSSQNPIYYEVFIKFCVVKGDK